MQVEEKINIDGKTAAELRRPIEEKKRIESE